MLDQMKRDNYIGSDVDLPQSHPTSLLIHCDYITSDDIEYVKRVSEDWPFIFFLTDYDVVGFYRLSELETGKWYSLIPINQVVPNERGDVRINDRNGLFSSQVDHDAEWGVVCPVPYYGKM